MKRQVKPIVALAAGTVLLLGGLCATVQAQSEVIESGSSFLAPTVMPVGGFAENPQEYLVISWSVTESISDVYTYSYTVTNLTGDVALNANGTLTTSPETVNNIEVTFNTTTPNAVVGTPPTPAGGYVQVTSVGLTWDFPAVNPGTNSAALTFQSDLAPGLGNASADPAPWASTSPSGTQLPVPRPVPEPATTTLLVLTLLLLPFRSALRRIL